MKSLNLIIFVIGVSLSQWLRGAELNVPGEFRELLKNPPLVAHVRENHEAVYSLGASREILVECKEYFSLISFTDEVDSGVVNYSFRSFSRKFGLEVEGSGQLEEKVFKISEAKPDMNKYPVLLIDRGSKNILNAGVFRIRWSLGGYLYHDGALKFKTGSLMDYKVLCRKYWEGGGRSGE